MSSESVKKPGRYASKLLEKNVLVFGGTSGIGFAVSEAAWESGARVTISGSNQPKLDAKLAQMRSNNPSGDSAKLGGLICDLANQDTVEKNLKAILDQVTDSEDGKPRRKLDHVVFCAGDAGDRRGLADIDIPYIHRSMMVRFCAPAIIAKLCLLHGYLEPEPSSSLTITGGVGATKPNKGSNIFAGVGGSVEGLARGLAVDLAPARVNCIAPGAVHTERFEAFAGDNVEGVLDRYRGRSITATVGKPEDLAEAYLYCMRDGFVTGSLIASNGGYLLA